MLKFSYTTINANARISPQPRFPKSGFSKLSALGLNLKYILYQYILNFFSTQFIRKPKRINIKQVYYNGIMFHPLGDISQAYNNYENIYYSISITLLNISPQLLYFFLLSHLIKSTQCYIKSTSISNNRHYSIITKTKVENQIYKNANLRVAKHASYICKQ